MVVSHEHTYDLIIIGGGQSGLAVAYYLRRTNLNYLILDSEDEPGGAWQHYWKSLRLFSPAQWSSLPGVIMSGGGDYYPKRDETITYLKNYVAKYKFPIHQSVSVRRVNKEGERFVLETNKGVYETKAIVSATGSFRNPVIPAIKGLDKFKGKVLHSSAYQSAQAFKGQRVAIVGEGNSGAQILAEVSKVADTIWVTQKEPRFLPDHVDGRYLFDLATQMYEARKAGRSFKPPSLGDIVMVPSVKEARERGVFKSMPPPDKITHGSLYWRDGTEENVDAIIFCTGFRPALDHLEGLKLLLTNGKPRTDETRSQDVPGLWFVGYGNWTGFASATLIGVGRSAKKTVAQITDYLK